MLRKPTTRSGWICCHITIRFKGEFLMNKKQYVFDTTKTTRYCFPTHINDLVMDRADAATSEVFVVIIEPGKAPPMHTHDDTEQIFYIIEGKGTLKIGKGGPEFDVSPGQIVRIPPSTPHLIKCTSTNPLKYIAVDCFINGRPKEEPTWESHAKVICKINSWDIKSVRKL